MGDKMNMMFRFVSGDLLMEEAAPARPTCATFAAPSASDNRRARRLSLGP